MSRGDFKKLEKTNSKGKAKTKGVKISKIRRNAWGDERERTIYIDNGDSAAKIVTLINDKRNKIGIYCRSSNMDFRLRERPSGKNGTLFYGRHPDSPDVVLKYSLIRDRKRIQVGLNLELMGDYRVYRSEALSREKREDLDKRVEPYRRGNLMSEKEFKTLSEGLRKE